MLVTINCCSINYRKIIGGGPGPPSPPPPLTRSAVPVIWEKLKSLEINYYITNWTISFLANRKQKVVVDGIETTYVGINRGVPQGTVLDPFFFSLMVNEIKPIDATINLLVKFVNDITVSAPVESGSDSVSAEVEGIQNWSGVNQMTLNLSKTWEMVVHSKSKEPLPTPIFQY